MCNTNSFRLINNQYVENTIVLLLTFPLTFLESKKSPLDSHRVSVIIFIVTDIKIDYQKGKSK